MTNANILTANTPISSSPQVEFRTATGEVRQVTLVWSDEVDIALNRISILATYRRRLIGSGPVSR